MLTGPVEAAVAAPRYSDELDDDMVQRLHDIAARSSLATHREAIYVLAAAATRFECQAGRRPALGGLTKFAHPWDWSELALFA
jgi:hypothetical protein